MVPAGHSAGDTHASRTGYYELNKIKEMARGQLPNNVWLTQQLTSNMNLNQTCNAFWDGGAVNFFRSGGGCNNTGEIAGVVLHEVGHGLDENDGGGFDNPSEAYGDITEFMGDRTSCIGRGFFQSGVCSGYGNPCTTCNGIRDMNWSARVNNVPSTPAVFIPSCPGGSGPCGKEVHCEGYLLGETLWDLATRDLPASGLSADSAWQLADRLFFQSRAGSSGNGYTCSGTTGNSCGAGHWYSKIRLVDDDDGNLANGTPHAAAIFAAFNRHGIPCGVASDTTNQNSTTCPAMRASDSRNRPRSRAASSANGKSEPAPPDLVTDAIRTLARRDGSVILACLRLPAVVGCRLRSSVAHADATEGPVRGGWFVAIAWRCRSRRRR